MELNQNQIKLLAVVGAVILVVGVSLLLFRSKPPAAPTTVKLRVWGVVDESDDLKTLFEGFRTAYETTYRGSKIEIEYKRWAEEEYENILVNRIAEGSGPDVFFIKNTWIPKHFPKIFPFPPEGFKPYIPNDPKTDPPSWRVADFERVFVKTVAKDLTLGGQIFAVPLYVDSLALYYNEDVYRSAGIQNSKPPLNWKDFNLALPSLGRGSFDGGVARSPAALGSAENIRLVPSRGASAPNLYENGSDLFSLFLLQRGGSYCAETCTTATFLQRGSSAGAALEEYTAYAGTGGTWSSAFVENIGERYVDDDVDAFVLGRVATIAGYSGLYEELRTKIGGKFVVKAASMPQIDPAAQRTTLASYWAAAIAKSSKHKQAGLELLGYMASMNAQEAYFRTTKRPPAREDLVTKLSNETAKPEDATYAVFIRQAQVATTLAIYDELALRKVLTSAIEDVLSGKLRRDEALRKIDEAITAMTKSEGRPVPSKVPK